MDVLFKGMGGQHDYWGLWFDSEYGKGECSETCTTFKSYVQLGVNKNFTIRNIEVWAVGEKPVKSTVMANELIYFLQEDFKFLFCNVNRRKFVKLFLIRRRTLAYFTEIRVTF